MEDVMLFQSRVVRPMLDRVVKLPVKIFNWNYAVVDKKYQNPQDAWSDLLTGIKYFFENEING